VKKIYLLLALLISFWSCDPSGSDDELEISMPVSVQEIKPSSIEEIISTTATVNAIKNTVIYSEVDGRYQLQRNPKSGKSYVPGDRISAGELVIVLDNPEHENNIKIQSQKLNLDISKREYEKQQSLYEKGGVTLRELKNSERTYIEAKYTYDNALYQLQKLRIRAPFSGTIIDLPYHTPNTRIPVNQVLMELMDYDQLYAEVFYPAKELGRIQVGQKLRVTHYSLSKDTLSGEVTQVAPALNPDTRSFKAQILVDNMQHLIRPGMFVKVETIISKKDSVIVIPKEIILSKRRGKTVYVVDKGAAFRRIVTTGIENDEQVEIMEGLKEKDRLVIKGFETLRNRSKVKIVR
jgi:RND family efflux transporter MFP subunit